MTSYTLKNNKRFTSVTRKNNKRQMRTDLKKNQRHRHRHEYSEGFIRRMTEPISFSIYTPTPDELKKLSIAGPILTDDEKWELYINGE